MRKLTIVLLTGPVLLLFTACSNNTPDLSYYLPKQKMVHANSKKYLIPRDTDKYFVVSKDQEEMFRQMKTSCRQGDIHWSTKKAQDVLSEVLKRGSNEQDKGKLSFFAIKKLHEMGGMGCAKAMTSKQKEAYRRELNQKQEMVNERLRYIQSNKPIKYEVHHTGNVGVYVYD